MRRAAKYDSECKRHADSVGTELSAFIDGLIEFTSQQLEARPESKEEADLPSQMSRFDLLPDMIVGVNMLQYGHLFWKVTLEYIETGAGATTDHRHLRSTDLRRLHRLLELENRPSRRRRRAWRRAAAVGRSIESSKIGREYSRCSSVSGVAEPSLFDQNCCV